MGQNIITFDRIEVEQQIFHQQKSLISIYSVNIGRKVVSNKVPFGKKRFEIFYWLQRW